MKYSLRTKLSLSYVLVILLCVSLLSIFTNVFLEKQFRNYVKENQEWKNKQMVRLIAQQYEHEGKWNRQMMENIGINALEQGLIIKIEDGLGNMIWDANVHNMGMCKQMIEHMSQNMYSRYPNWKGGYVEYTYPVMVDAVKVGHVDIGSYGPFYFNDNDLTFINTLNKLFIGVGIFSFVFALVLGALMAKRISMPISRVINAAQMISKGYFGGRITEKSNTVEINQLTDTINHVGEALEKQEILRKRLSADVAHELRTPLATLQSHMEAMIDGIWQPDKERLESCHEEIMRISRMVGDLERLAQYESENIILHKTQFDISKVIQQILQNFESDFSRKGIEITCEGEEEMMFADRDKISQVIINLLSNALKYTHEGGKVHISVTQNAENTYIRVKDNGIGIAEADIPYIFERFYRVDQSRSRSTGGSGIGLTIAKTIVEMHKGEITVQSKLNEGTEFTIILPKNVE